MREEVETVRTALAAVEWPDDELVVYGTLRGSLFAIGDEVLIEYRERIGRLHPFRAAKPGDGEAVPDRLVPVVDALTLLRELHRQRNLRPVEDTIDALLTATRAHAAFMIRPSGEQALANVLRISDLARTWETSGGISFRGFVEQLREEAEGEAPEAPIVEEGSEGVRIMTVHKAKGLEFPVVILADITANVASASPGRYIDADHELCAVRLAGWSPMDLLTHESEEVARDRAEGVRLAYVAATRARDLLVVPAVGDDPSVNRWEAAKDGWIAPLHAAIYPSGPEQRRASAPAPTCPPFGEDSVLERPDRETPGRDNVQPGLHLFPSGSEPPYGVVWWDPRALTLDQRPSFGIRRQELIEDPGPEVLDGAKAVPGVASFARSGARAGHASEPRGANGDGVGTRPCGRCRWCPARGYCRGRKQWCCQAVRAPVRESRPRDPGDGALGCRGGGNRGGRNAARSDPCCDS